MRKLLLAGVVPVCLLAAPIAWSADEGPKWGSLGIGIGTGGLGVDFAYPLNSYIDLRVGYDFGTLTVDQEEEGIEYEAKLKFSSGRFLVDLKPFAGGFRISAGLYSGSPELELNASGDDEYEVGDRTYNGDLDLVGDLDLGSAAPYLGLGWGGTAGTTGFGMSFDLGVIFTDAPSVALAVPRGRACDATVNGGCDPNSDPTSFDVAGNSAAAMEFQADVERERLSLEQDAKDFDLWPIIRVGLHYRF